MNEHEVRKAAKQERRRRWAEEFREAWAAQPVLVFLTVAAIAIMVAVSLQVQFRTTAIEQIQQSAVEIEQAAEHTEEILVDVIESQNSPEGRAQDAAVAAALREISQIKDILCQMEGVGSSACSDD